MPRSFADEIRDRVPSVLTDSATMLAMIFTLYLIMPITYVTGYVIPGVGVAGGMLIGIGALVISLTVEARLYRNLQALSNALAGYIVERRGDLLPERKEKIRTAFSDLGKTISLLLLLALISPILAIIPGIGVMVVALPILGILIVALYAWASWSVVKEELERIFKTFAGSLAEAFEK